MQSTDDLREVLTTILGQIANADQKASALLTIAGVLVAFPEPSILMQASADNVPWLAIVRAGIAGCAFVVSIYGALMVLFPRTNIKTDKLSLAYFGDIASTTKEEYAAAVNRADEDRVRDDLISQIHINAQIARKKHGQFKLSVFSLIVGIVFLGACYVGIAAAGRPAH